MTSPGRGATTRMGSFRAESQLLTHSVLTRCKLGGESGDRHDISSTQGDEPKKKISDFHAAAIPPYVVEGVIELWIQP